MSERHVAADCDIRGAPSATEVSDSELLERFVISRDDAAFAALMARHGPMVLGVCRRLLHHTQDVEDAFQATFLVLVRKAASIGKRELLGNWLYGVALRVAARARDMAAKQRTREATDMERIAEPTREPAEATDVSAAITEEVQRLPVKYRIPVVLCYLEGRSNEEAAGAMRCPVGTVKTRLSRAREMLRRRLIQRGLALPTAAFSTALSVEALAAPLSPALFDSALKAALDFAAGDAAVLGLVSAQAAALTKGVLHTMFVSKMKTVAVAVLALVMTVSGIGAFAYHLFPEKDQAKSKDKESIQGTWKAESLIRSGVNVELEREIEYIFTADKATVRVGGEIKKEGTYKIDPDNEPKTIDFSSPENGGDIREEGIYRLEGDKLVICAAHPNKPRPKKFDSEEGSGVGLVKLRRVKK